VDSEFKVNNNENSIYWKIACKQLTIVVTNAIMQMKER